MQLCNDIDSIRSSSATRQIKAAWSTEVRTRGGAGESKRSTRQIYHYRANDTMASSMQPVYTRCNCCSPFRLCLRLQYYRLQIILVI